MSKKGREFDHSHYQTWMDPKELIPYPKNAKQHDKAQVKNIANSIRRFGWQQEAVVTQDNVLVIGHGRRLAALMLKCEMPVKIIDQKAEELTDEDIRELRIADNKTNESPWDFDLLADDLEGLDFEGFDFDFDLPEDEDPVVITEDDYDKPMPEEPKSKPGDIYQLGRHRLMCGDSTNMEDVAALMGGKCADMVLTDPPYGTTNCEWDRTSVLDIWDCVKSVIIKNAAVCVFSQQPFTTELINRNRKQFKYDIIWNKSHSTGFLNAKKAPMRAHEIICVFYQEQPTYNPIMQEAEHAEIGRKKNSGTKAKQYNDYIPGMEYEDTGKRYPTDVVSFSSWNGARLGDTKNATVHPTQKPIELMAYLVRTYSNENDFILDIFGGSGSTLIASEQTGRNCFIMELDPRYVDVIIDRWETFTGEKAGLINDEG